MTTDVFGSDRFPSAASFDHRPRVDRRTCRLTARIATRGGHTVCTIVNISIGGLGFDLAPLIRLRLGEAIVILHDRLGELHATVRWSMHPRYGAAFDAAGARSQAVRAFYDSLPAEPPPE